MKNPKKTGARRSLRVSPGLLGRPIHLGAWLESGSAFETPGDAVLPSDLSGGLPVETLMGALLVGGSIGDDGSAAFHVALGRPFWEGPDAL